MRIDIKIESIEDLNNNLAFISANYYKFSEESQNYIYGLIYDYIKNTLININIKQQKILAIINKFSRNNHNVTMGGFYATFFENLCDFLIEWFFNINDFDAEKICENRELYKLNKILIIDELIYIKNEW